MFIETRKRAIQYWLKFLKLPDEKYVKNATICCTILMALGTIIGRQIKDILCTYDFWYVWENQRFVNLLIQVMKDHFLIEWNDGINSNRNLCDYVYFKMHFGYEMILDILKVRKFRSLYCKFRLSCHYLEINRGRFNNTERENRKCNFFKNKVENEYHFL